FVGLITLCVTLVLSTFLAQSAGSQWKVGSVPLGGDNGINNIPALGFEQGSAEVKLTGNLFYFVVVFLLIFLYLLFMIIQNTKSGYSLVAVREKRERSHLLGFNIPLLQTLSFSFGGMLAAFSGVLYATWGGYI